MDSEKKQYFKLGLTLFLSLGGVVLLFFLCLRFGEIKGFFNTIISALQPVYLAIVLTYLLYPLSRKMEKGLKKVKRISKFAKVIAATTSVIFALCILSMVFALLIPQLSENITNLVLDLPDMLQTQLTNLQAFLESHDRPNDDIMNMITQAETAALEWIRTNIVSTISSLASSVISIGSIIINIIISFIVSIYLLLDWERYLAQFKKLFRSIVRNEKVNNAVFEGTSQADKIFSGFIRGKMLDSLIVGIICFIALTIMRMPYTLLISVVVGITNIIPVFGPFIGAIPSGFLLLLVSPSKCLTFLIFIVILQQIDGNIIGPRILGDSTGLSAIYIIIAMLVFGKTMGFFGMLLGVPIFATIYYIVKKIVERSLKKQDLPVETSAYYRYQEDIDELKQKENEEPKPTLKEKLKEIKLKHK